MYWTDTRVFDPGRIARSNLDGTGIEELVVGLGSPVGLALDFQEGKMYWVDSVNRRIERANLHGSEIELLLNTSAVPIGLALDPCRSLVYWTGAVPNGSGSLFRANLERCVQGPRQRRCLVEEFFRTEGASPRGLALMRCGEGDSEFERDTLRCLDGPAEFAAFVCAATSMTICGWT
jgi:hypothetical protein